MFLAPDGKTYEPYKVRTRKKEKPAVENGADVEMKDDNEVEEEEEIELPEDDEGAIYPLKGM
jgi:actin-related protein 9